MAMGFAEKTSQDAVCGACSEKRSGTTFVGFAPWPIPRTRRITEVATIKCVTLCRKTTTIRPHQCRILTTRNTPPGSSLTTTTESQMGYQKIQVPASGDKITVNADLSLNVPDNPIIPFIEGDGIGV